MAFDLDWACLNIFQLFHVNSSFVQSTLRRNIFFSCHHHLFHWTVPANTPFNPCDIQRFCLQRNFRCNCLILILHIKPFSNTVQFFQLPTQFRHCHQTKWFVNHSDYFECHVVWWMFDHRTWMRTLLEECVCCQQLNSANMSWVDSLWVVSLFSIKILILSKASNNNNCSIKSIDQHTIYLLLNYNFIYADYSTSRTLEQLQHCIFCCINY